VLALSLYNITAASVTVGLAQGLETLCSQARPPRSAGPCRTAAGARHKPCGGPPAARLLALGDLLDLHEPDAPPLTGAVSGGALTALGARAPRGRRTARATSARWASGCSWAWACAAWRLRRSCACGASWGGCCSRRVRAPARRPVPAAAGRCNLGRCRQAGRDSAACPQCSQRRERQTAAGRPARGTPAPTPRASCASHAGAPGGRAGQDEGIVRGAMLYLYLSLPALWCYSVVECVKRYLLSQARPRAAAPWS